MTIFSLLCFFPATLATTPSAQCRDPQYESQYHGHARGDYPCAASPQDRAPHAATLFLRRPAAERLREL
jgi:hypothetical protein